MTKPGQRVSLLRLEITGSVLSRTVSTAVPAVAEIPQFLPCSRLAALILSILRISHGPERIPYSSPFVSYANQSESLVHAAILGSPRFQSWPGSLFTDPIQVTEFL